MELGWVSGQEVRSNVSMDTMTPAWSDASVANSTIDVGQGFTPSGPMLRALLALSTTPLPSAERDNGQGGYDLQNPHDGFGQLNLSVLLDFEALIEELEGGTPPLQTMFGFMTHTGCWINLHKSGWRLGKVLMIRSRI